LGHSNQEATCRSAKALGWNLKPGGLQPCKACAAAKAKQKNVHKKVYMCQQVQAMKEFIWIMLQWNCLIVMWKWLIQTGILWLMSECRWNSLMSSRPKCNGGTYIWKIWNGNKLASQWKMSNWIFLEGTNFWKPGVIGLIGTWHWFWVYCQGYTATDHLAELAFATCQSWKSLDACSKHSNGYLILSLAWSISGSNTFGWLVIDGKSAMRVEHWCGKVPAFAKHLRTWGEVGNMKVKTVGTPKISGWGVHCIFVQYALNHAGDCYHM